MKIRKRQLLDGVLPDQPITTPWTSRPRHVLQRALIRPTGLTPYAEVRKEPPSFCVGAEPYADVGSAFSDGDAGFKVKSSRL